MQHFMIPCDFGGRKAPFPIYVGEPKADAHPLQHQSSWLSSARGGSIPQEVMDSFEKLHKIALENNVSFEELCVYAMGEALGSQPVTDSSLPPPPPPADDMPQMQEQGQPEPAYAPMPTEPAQPTSSDEQGNMENYEPPVDPYRNNQS